MSSSKDVKRRQQLQARERKRQQAQKQWVKKQARKVDLLADAFLDMIGRWLHRDHSKATPFTDQCPDCRGEIRLWYETGRLHYDHCAEWCEGWVTFDELHGSCTPPLETLTPEAIDAKFRGVTDIRFNPETGNIDVTGSAMDAMATAQLGTRATGSATLTASRPDPRLPVWAQGAYTLLSLADGQALIESGKVKSSLTIQHGEGNRVSSTEVIARTEEGLFRFPALGTHVLPRSTRAAH